MDRSIAFADNPSFVSARVLFAGAAFGITT
jgi:hypothetical protein